MGVRIVKDDGLIWCCCSFLSFRIYQLHKRTVSYIVLFCWAFLHEEPASGLEFFSILHIYIYIQTDWLGGKQAFVYRPPFVSCRDGGNRQSLMNFFLHGNIQLCEDELMKFLFFFLTFVIEAQDE